MRAHRSSFHLCCVVATLITAAAYQDVQARSTALRICEQRHEQINSTCQSQACSALVHDLALSIEDWDARNKVRDACTQTVTLIAAPRERHLRKSSTSALTLDFMTLVVLHRSSPSGLRVRDTQL